MKKVFKIYPAVFLLTPNRQKEPATCKGRRIKNPIDCHTADGCFFNGDAQAHYGRCDFNCTRTIVSIQFCLNTHSRHSFLNLPELLFSTLRPKIWTGKNYTLTYVEVNN